MCYYLLSMLAKLIIETDKYLLSTQVFLIRVQSVIELLFHCQKK